MVELGAVGVSIGIEFLKRTAPKGLAFVTSYIKGATILVVGPSGSGKTSFLEYLSMGVLHPKGAHHFITTDVTKSPTFTVSVGRDGALQLKVRKTLDVPGQYGAMNHANLVRERRPNAVVVVLDSTFSDAKLRAWMTTFGEQLESALLTDSKLRSRIRVMMILLNQADRVREQTLKRRIGIVRSALEQSMQGAFGRQWLKSVPVQACVAVETDQYGSTLLDAAIRRLALALKR